MSGYAQKNKKKTKTRGQVGANVLARVKHDMEITKREAQQRDAFKVNAQAQWAESWCRKANLRGVTLEGQKAREEEIEMANRELVTLRRYKIQQLYEQDLQR